MPTLPEDNEPSARCRAWTRANTTLIASLSRQGMGEAFILEGAADAVAFELSIEQILAPSLHSGQIVIMDNLSIHQGARV